MFVFFLHNFDFFQYEHSETIIAREMHLVDII